MDAYCTAVAKSLETLNGLIESKNKLMKNYTDTNDEWQAIDSDNEDFGRLENKMEMIKIQLASTDIDIMALSNVLKVHDPKEIDKFYKKNH